MLNFQIDREDPPLVFYTPVTDFRGMKTGVDVLAVSGEHPNLGYMTLGIVTRQTPFGQQGHFGFLHQEIRRATPDEVRAALSRNHELGEGYIPEIMPSMSRARYQLIRLRWKSITERQRTAVLQSLPHS